MHMLATLDIDEALLEEARRLSGLREKTARPSHTFDAAGVYDYICGLHPNMKGSVEVK